MIPKIIHQLWIGPKPPPTNLMNTWKTKHESHGFQYIRWTEEELKKRNFTSQVQPIIDDMIEINGKADILRWEILYEYGGVFVDADSYCIEPFTYLVEKYSAFAGYENEQVRGKGWGGKQYSDILADTHPLIATGTMAFPKHHDLPRRAIEWIKNNPEEINKKRKRAWRTVGPGLLTRLYFSKKWDDITILPSYLFLPVHFARIQYGGHGKVYAHQEWGSTKQSYHKMNNIDLPAQFQRPNKSCSILISSYNTKAIYIKECLNSIQEQVGHIYFEIIWINDGSDELHTSILKKLLEEFEHSSRFIKLCYYENEENKGIGFTLNKGVLLCNHEIIIKMDSDDIMVKDRIEKQFSFMMNNPHVQICGGQIQMFDDNKNNRGITNHKSLTWDQYKAKPSHWFLNQPTVCYRKSSVIKAGNYDKTLHRMCEDFELWLRMLKLYGYIHNLTDILLHYRLHENQVTHNGGEGGRNKWKKKRNEIIESLI